MGIKVVESDHIDYSGAAVSNNERAIIVVNSAESWRRQRFTVAHEIGHLILHPLGVKWRDETFVGTKAEAQANGYAAGLLMPFYLLESQFTVYGPNIGLLSDVFAVSTQAMSYRLDKMLG